MSKIELPTVTSGYNLSTINTNFQKIEDTLNKEVLYRKGYLGEPNEMQTNLDMNGNQILNVTTGTSDGSLVTKGYVDQGLALKFDKSGGPMSGSVDMSSNEIINVSRLSANTLEIGGVQVVPTDLVVDTYSRTREALRRSYAEAGYNLVAGSFEAGGTLVNANDVLLQERTGKAFSGPAGTVAAGTNPTGGGFVDKSGGLLRHELATSDGAAKVGNANGGSVQDFVDKVEGGDLTVIATGSATPRTLSDRFADTVNVKDFGAVGDGVTDDTAAIQACLDFGGRSSRIYFPRTESNEYIVSSAIKFYPDQQWIGSGGIDLTAESTPTKISLKQTSTSVAEPIDKSVTTYGFRATGFCFNAGVYAPIALNLFGTSYAHITACSAFTSQDGGAAIHLETGLGGEQQCYFNHLTGVRVYASGFGGAGLRFDKGANANVVTGGRLGGSYRGIELLNNSYGNLFLASDLELNEDCGAYIDAPANCFVSCNIEGSPVGLKITANGTLTSRLGNIYETTMVDVSDASASAAVIECERGADGNILGKMQAGRFKIDAPVFSTSSEAYIDLGTQQSDASSDIKFFRRTETTGATRVYFYKGDGTSDTPVVIDAKAGKILTNTIRLGRFSSEFIELQSRNNPPISGTYKVGDIVRHNDFSSNSPVTEWVYTSDGVWRASAWVVNSGLTSERPSALRPDDKGVMYFDTTLSSPAGKPIWWNGSVWVDATGAPV